MSGDVLGALIARVSGQTFGAFLRERIFDPLGMKDTAFHVPPEKISRLPACYFFNRETNKLDFFDDPVNSAWRVAPAGESGGGGLLSTIDDYFAFSRMMLKKGRYGREQILSRASVELMTSDHLTPEQRVGAEIFFGTHSSWGLGMAIDIRREEIYHTPRPFRLDRRLWHNRLHRSRRKQNRHPFYTAHDGFPGCTKNLYRFLDTCLHGDGIDPFAIRTYAPSPVGALPFAIGT